MPKKEEGAKGYSVYSGMSWPGLIGYILDKHFLNAIVLVAILIIPGVFLFLYYNAKSGELQQKLLGETYHVLSSLNLTYALGWVLSGFLGIGILSLRSVYKAEIHRLAEEKNYYLKKLGIEKGTSGHSEKQMD